MQLGIYRGVCVRHWAGGKRGGGGVILHLRAGTSVGIVDFPSMVLDGLPSWDSKGIGGADPRWSCLSSGVVR